MEPFRFVFMADCQLGCYATFSGRTEADVADYAARGMMIRVAPPTEGLWWDARNYEIAIAMANDLEPDFVVMGGDMVDDPADDGQYQEVLRITEALRCPMHWVAGNHDVGEDTNVPTAASIARYRERFGSDHYAFEHKGATLIAVNTVVWAHADRVPDEWEVQLAFLEDQLAVGTDRGGPILVFGHHPLFLRDPDEDDDYFNIPVERRHLLLDLLADHGAAAFLCGHWHRNGGGTYRGLDVAVTGPVGYPLGDDPSGFRIVDVDAEGVTHQYVPLQEEE